MSDLFEQDLILPGAITEIVSDYESGYDSSKFGSTDAIVLVGTAFDGPVGKVVPVYSPEHAKYMFGPTYNTASKKEASLVAGIKDAYDRGGRTIYAVRVSGKPIYRDYQLAVDEEYKLRVSGFFPSNANKDVFMVFDDAINALKLSIFKSAARSTIQEKVAGLVESESAIMENVLDLSTSYGLTKDSKLTDLINIVNENTRNNVMKLAIINSAGVDVTLQPLEVQGLTVGAMFPGLYTVGRDESLCSVATDLNYVVATAENKPYDSFDGVVFKSLVVNTDVAADLPIYGSVANLNSKFAVQGVTVAALSDIVSVAGQADLLFKKDAVDYEEVDVAGFELYKKLGTGFASTAKAVAKGVGGDVKIIEAPTSDENRIVTLNDGIYSALENVKAKYRVLLDGSADEAIVGKLPKKAEFKKAFASSIDAFNENVVAKAIVDADDKTAAKKYKFVISTAEGAVPAAAEVEAGLLKTVVAKEASVVAVEVETLTDTYANGSLFLEKAGAATVYTLHKFVNGTFKEMSSATVFADLAGKFFFCAGKLYKGAVNAGKIEFTEVATKAGISGGTFSYVLVESLGVVYVYKISETEAGVGPLVFAPVGQYSDVLDIESEEKVLVVVQSAYSADNVITVNASNESASLYDLVDALNENDNLKTLFAFELSAAGALLKDDEIGGADTLVLADSAVAVADKTVGYSTTLYIPFKTTDTFDRHLAQHCTYTSLKTAPTHGVLGVSKLLDTSNLKAVSEKVTSLVTMAHKISAKIASGRDMLDKNNLPYMIGRNISAPVTQYAVATLDNYNFISNGAAGYAGFVSQLALDQSSTAQTINVPQPMYELTSYQLEKLTQAGFVTIRNSYTKGYVVTDGITMADPDSVYRRLSTTRIINALDEQIRAAVEPYLGKQNHLANRNAMYTAIKSSTDKMKDIYISGVEINLRADKAAEKLGIIYIDYAVTPLYEIRQVRNSIKIQES
jgi:hypothetical protein